MSRGSIVLPVTVGDGPLITNFFPELINAENYVYETPNVVCPTPSYAYELVAIDGVP